ncbi:MAG TPA: hypothetical protein VLM38_23675 [Blastocatellia bacterium]|nr:hypothetical protein [Blastocatellia bacterium]
MRLRDSGLSTDAELRTLRESISDVGHQIDSYKTKVAGALAGGIFALLLAAGAFYDLAAGKSGVWLLVGITRENLVWIASGLALASVVLLTSGLRLRTRRDRSLYEKLDQMEQAYADLVAHKDTESNHERNPSESQQ